MCYFRVWRSLVSRLTGGQEAAGSSPVTRTIEESRKSLCCNGLRDSHILLICGLVVVWSLFIIQHTLTLVRIYWYSFTWEWQSPPGSSAGWAVSWIIYGQSYSSYSIIVSQYAKSRKPDCAYAGERMGVFFVETPPAGWGCPGIACIMAIPKTLCLHPGPDGMRR